MRSMPGPAPRRGRRGRAAPARALPTVAAVPDPRRVRRAGAAVSASLFLALPLALVGVPAVSASTHSAAYARYAAVPDTTLTTAAFLAERSALDPSVLSLITFGEDEVPTGVVAFGIPAPAVDAQALVSSSRFVSPVPGPITSAFGPRFHPILHYVRNHNGVDMTAACGTPVVAMTDGKVTRSGVGGGYGNLVEIDHGIIDGSRMVTRYAHLSVLGAKVGQQVSKGQQIGLAGTTGLSTGCHLHFEVLVNGAYVNPAAVLSGAPYTRLDIPMTVVEQPTADVLAAAALVAETPLPVATAEPTPEATASATPTPALTPTPTPTPTPQASATPTPTPTPTATATPTASATATATSAPTSSETTPPPTTPPATEKPTPTAQPSASSAATSEAPPPAPASAKPQATAAASTEGDPDE